MTAPKSLTCLVLASVLALLACDREKRRFRCSLPRCRLIRRTFQLNFPPDNGPPPTVDGDRAMQYTKEIVKFGPRPLGSANHKKVEDYIASHLKGDQVEDDIFTADTQKASFRFTTSSRNFRARKTASFSSPAITIRIIRCAIPHTSARTTAHLPARCCLSSRTSCAASRATVTAYGWSGMMPKRQWSRTARWTSWPTACTALPISPRSGRRTER